MYANSRFATRRNLIILVFLFGTLLLVISGPCHIKKVQIDIPDNALSTIETTVPRSTFAMYVSADTVPKCAEELRHFSLDVASSDDAVSAITIAQQLGMSGAGQGAGARDNIQYNLLLISPRTDKAPPYVVEVVLK